MQKKRKQTMRTSRKQAEQKVTARKQSQDDAPNPRMEVKRNTSQDKTNQQQSDSFVKALSGVQYSIDVLMAFLLLSGQIATTGIFVVPEGFAFSVSGDVFGFSRLKGRTPALDIDLDYISVLIALLLIIGQVRVQGPYVSGTGLFIVITGPIFGYKSVPGAINPVTQEAQMLGQIMKEEMLKRLED